MIKIADILKMRYDKVGFFNRLLKESNNSKLIYLFIYGRFNFFYYNFSEYICVWYSFQKQLDITVCNEALFVDYLMQRDTIARVYFRVYISFL